jgi:long-subunit acyl-CoA synthetase (AMP-forming)
VDETVAGAPLRGVDVRIAGGGADGVGEILVRGPIVMAGYFENAEASARGLRDGWLHTGDLGRLDGSGRLQVVGRRSDLIVSGGENVTPDEVEAVLRRHPAVAEAAVYGVPDARWGERVLAAVVPAGADFDEQGCAAGAARTWQASRCRPKSVRSRTSPAPRPVRCSAIGSPSVDRGGFGGSEPVGESPRGISGRRKSPASPNHWYGTPRSRTLALVRSMSLRSIRPLCR